MTTDLLEMDLKEINFGAHRTYLDKLLELHHKYTNARSDNAKKINELEEENEKLKQRLSTVTQIKAKLEGENLCLEKKLESKKFKEPSKDLSKYFDLLCDLAGYCPSDIIWDKEEKILYIKCYFNEDSYVRFGISNGQMNCLEIVPTHPNFETIQEHFRSTQDAASLLTFLRKQSL